ncbi:MAG: enoyl-ACP reductase FabV [Coprobacillaceae bacterium]
MIIKPRYRGFICTTAHPVGCYKNVEDLVKKASALNIVKDKRPKNVVVIGASSGYGLASRVIASFAYGAKTIGVSFEKEGSKKHTATAGYYNNIAFDSLAEENGIPTLTIHGDAFSNETKEEVIIACKEMFENEKIDLLIYSLAAPTRTDPNTNTTYSSVIKPIGHDYHNKTVDFHSGEVSETIITPASTQEIEDTVKVMGGEDWQLWIERLLEADVLANDVTTIAYSYIGPSVTHPIYKDGTIGKAKDHLWDSCQPITDILKPLQGKAYVSVNKALVTQASSAIPVVPLYISLLYKIMKENGNHEGCFEQIERLFKDYLYSSKADINIKDKRIRMDDYEMSDEVQAEVDRIWSTITTDTVDELTDIDGYRKEFFSLFGFGRDDVDYNEDIEKF